MARLNRVIGAETYYIGWYGDCETECENIKLQKLGLEEISEEQQTIMDQFAESVYVIYEFSENNQTKKWMPDRPTMMQVY